MTKRKSNPANRAQVPVVDRGKAQSFADFINRTPTPSGVTRQDVMKRVLSECEARGILEKPAEVELPVATEAKSAEPLDPWQHRSVGMRCKTCMWFVQKESLHRDPRGPLGRCRRHAPTMNGYPAVFPVDWCGDHKLDETKL